MVAAVPCQFARADIVFVVDSSRSICGGDDSSCASWRSLLNFVNSIVDQLNIGFDNTRLGFVRYSSVFATSNEFFLNGNQYNKRQVMSAVSDVDYVTGGRLVGDLSYALQVARTQQFVSDRGDRIGAPNIIILLMNGGVDVTSNAVSVYIFIT